MNTSTRRLKLSPILACLAALAAASIGGCGPGVGGTGTRVVPFDAFGASPSPICSAAIASSLSCPAPAPAPAPAPTAPPTLGTAATYFANSLDNQRARVEGNRIELQLPCLGWVFDGDWGNSAGLGERFFGSLNQAGGVVNATLTAVVVSRGVQFQLFDAQGQALTPALPLLPGAAPQSPSACR